MLYHTGRFEFSALFWGEKGENETKAVTGRQARRSRSLCYV